MLSGSIARQLPTVVHSLVVLGDKEGAERSGPEPITGVRRANDLSPARLKMRPGWYNPGTLRNPIGGRVCQYLNEETLKVTSRPSD